jgi:hypothetical protein
MGEKRKPTPPRQCIFCGEGPISREHVWAKWMRDYLPTGQGQQAIQETDFTDSTVRTRPGPLTKKGDARSQKLKVVCVNCNNGWMSKIQARTKPVLLPLLLGHPKSIAGWDQHSLAVWLTMFGMIYETTIPEYAATINAQRVAFKEQEEPPEHWMFWCAPFDGKSSPAIQTGFRSTDRHPVTADGASEINKGSLTLCGCGAVSFAIFSVNSGRAVQAFSQFIPVLIERAGFTRLWPIPGRAVEVTNGRLLPLTWADMCAIKDVVRDSIGATYKRNH